MKIPILPRNFDLHLRNSQKCVNFYLERGFGGPGDLLLVSTPGLSGNYGTDAASIIQEVYTATTGQVFGIIGDTLYEYGPSSKTSRGSLGITASTFSMADNGTTLLIVADGVGAVRCALSAGSVTSITDGNFPASPIGAAFLDGYLITGVVAGTFYLSQLYDANDWTPVQFATAESSPDKLTDIRVVGRTMYAIGYQTIEAWYNTGNPDFPLERISGQAIQYGCRLKPLIAVGSGGIFFVGGERGFGNGFYFYSGGSLEKISTPFIEDEFGFWGATQWTSCYYKYKAESIYEITTPDSVTYAYHVNTKTWAEKRTSSSSFRIKKYANLSGTSGAADIILAFDKTIDRASNLSIVYSSEYGSDVTRYYDFIPVGDGSVKYFHKSFILDVSVQFTSVGDLTLDPTLSWSDNGGNTYSSGIQLSKTATVATNQSIRFKWTRLGSSHQRIYRVTFVGPDAKLVIKNAEVDLVIGGPG